MKDKDIIKLLEDIRYSVYNSSIMIVQTNSRFTYAMSKYIRDYPEYFEKDIEDFRNGLDYDSLQSLNSWIFQRKLDGNLIDFYRVPASSPFFTEEQKIIYFTKHQIYD